MKKIWLLLLAMIFVMCFGLSFNKIEAAASSSISVGNDTYNLVTSQQDIVSGKYIIAYESNYLGALDGSIHKRVTSTSDALVLTFESTTNENEFTISYDKNGTKTYLSYSGTRNNIQNITDGTAQSAKFLVTIDTNSVVKINSVNVTERYLQYNTSSPRFACYENSQKDLALYKLDSSSPVCQHANTTFIEAVEATCTSKGNIAYTLCNDCNKYFSGNGTTTIITLEDTVIPALGHNHVNGTCTRCGDVKLTVDDVITAANLKATSTTYKEFSNVKLSSGVVYAGNSSKNGESISLRTENSNSGIVVTSNEIGLVAKKIVVEWTSTTGNRQIDVYGSETAYTAASQLYSETNAGTSLGSIVYGTSTELVLTGDYKYIGLRSKNGALAVSHITIEWGYLTESRINAFKASSPKASLQLLGTEDNITGMNLRFGGVISALAYESTATYGVLVLTSPLESTSLTSADISAHITNKTALECTPAKLADGSYQFAWVLSNTIAQENYVKPIYVYLYMIQDGNVYLSQCSTYTVNDIVLHYAFYGTDLGLSEAVIAYLDSKYYEPTQGGQQ